MDVTLNTANSDTCRRFVIEIFEEWGKMRDIIFQFEEKLDKDIFSEILMRVQITEILTTRNIHRNK